MAEAGKNAIALRHAGGGRREYTHAGESIAGQDVQRSTVAALRAGRSLNANGIINRDERGQRCINADRHELNPTSRR